VVTPSLLLIKTFYLKISPKLKKKIIKRVLCSFIVIIKLKNTVVIYSLNFPFIHFLLMTVHS
jgi:hypothetical protein